MLQIDCMSPGEMFSAWTPQSQEPNLVPLIAGGWSTVLVRTCLLNRLFTIWCSHEDDRALMHIGQRSYDVFDNYATFEMVSMFPASPTGVHGRGVNQSSSAFNIECSTT